MTRRWFLSLLASLPIIGRVASASTSKPPRQLESALYRLVDGKREYVAQVSSVSLPQNSARAEFSLHGVPPSWAEIGNDEALIFSIATDPVTEYTFDARVVMVAFAFNYTYKLGLQINAIYDANGEPSMIVPKG